MRLLVDLVIQFKERFGGLVIGIHRLIHLVKILDPMLANIIDPLLRIAHRLARDQDEFLLVHLNLSFIE